MKIIRNNTHKMTRRFEHIDIGDTFESDGRLYIKIPRVEDGPNAEQFAVDGMPGVWFEPGELCILVDVTVSYSYRPQSGEEESK